MENTIQAYQLINEKAAAALLDVSVYKLQKDRITGQGLRYVTYGRCVRYRLNDIAAFIEANTRRSTSEG